MNKPDSYYDENLELVSEYDSNLTDEEEQELARILEEREIKESQDYMYLHLRGMI